MLLASSAFSQTISYTYDDAGNRVSRKVVVLDNKKTGTLNSQDQQNQEDALLEDRQGNLQVKVYPNPTRGMLRVEIKQAPLNNAGNEPLENARVTIHDMSGREIYSNPRFGPRGNIDLSGQPIGVYIMRVQASTSTS